MAQDDVISRVMPHSLEAERSVLGSMLIDPEAVVIPFPMSGTAQDLMCGAPNEITEQQLREVHIKIR